MFLPGQQEITEVCKALSVRFGASAVKARNQARNRSRRRLARLNAVNRPATLTNETSQDKDNGGGSGSGSGSGGDGDSTGSNDSDEDDEDEDEDEQRKQFEKEGEAQEKSDGVATRGAAKEDAADAIADNDDDEDDEEDKIQPMHILPLYGMLPREQQLRVWQPAPEGTRLVVVATNVAESSITIPGTVLWSVLFFGPSCKQKLPTPLL